MNVLSLAGSLHQTSTSRSALRVSLAGAASAGAATDSVDLRRYQLPCCDGRSDISTYGADFVRLLEQVRWADALLVGSPEYHGSMSGVLKNAIDLLGEDPLRGKMVGLLAVARGDAGAMNTLNHLRHVFRWVGAWVLPTQVSIPRAREAFDTSGDPTRAGLAEELRGLGAETVRYARLLAGNGGPSA